MTYETIQNDDIIYCIEKSTNKKGIFISSKNIFVPLDLSILPKCYKRIDELDKNSPFQYGTFEMTI